MRILILVLLLLFQFALTNAQPDINYIDKTGEICSKEKAWYLRVVDPETKGYHVREFDMVGNLYMDAYCSSINPIVFDGLCSYYYKNGKKRMETRFENDRSTGWRYWTGQGEETNKNTAAGEVYKDTTIHRIKDITDNNFKPAIFPGGDVFFSEYVTNELQYPGLIQWRKIYDKMHIAFVIDTTGKLRNINFSNRMGDEFEVQVRKTLSSSPLWEPATYAGKKVKMCILYTIQFGPKKE